MKVLEIIKRVDNEAQEILQAAHEQLSGSYEIQKALDMLQVVSEKNKQLMDDLRLKATDVKVSETQAPVAEETQATLIEE
jgi:hypothetical protein